MRPLTDDDFPIVAIGHNVYRQTESGPICTCAWQGMATEIAARLNRDHIANRDCYTLEPPSATPPKSGVKSNGQ